MSSVTIGNSEPELCGAAGSDWSVWDCDHFLPLREHCDSVEDSNVTRENVPVGERCDQIVRLPRESASGFVEFPLVPDSCQDVTVKESQSDIAKQDCTGDHFRGACGVARGTQAARNGVDQTPDRWTEF